jgi:hypothetical protein
MHTVSRCFVLKVNQIRGHGQVNKKGKLLLFRMNLTDELKQTIHNKHLN